METRARSVGVELALLVIIVATPLAGLIAYLLYDTARRDEAHAAGLAMQMAVTTADRAARYVETMRTELEAVAKRPLIRAMDPNNCDPQLADLRELYGHPANIIVINLKGRIICGATPPPRERVVRIVDEELRAMLAEPRFRLSKPLIGSITQRWTVGAEQPVLAPAGGLAGMVAIGIDLTNWVSFSPIEGEPKGTVHDMVTADGIVIARSAESEAWIGRNVSASEIHHRMLEMKHGTVRAHGSEGADRLWGFTPVAGTNWYARSSVSANRVFGPVRQRTVDTAILLAIALGVAFVAAFASVARLVRPMRTIAVALRSRTEGRSEVRVPVAGVREVRELAGELNRMIDAGELGAEALRASEARFRSLTELSSDWYWEQDAELRFVATQGLTDARGGITPAAHIGKRRWELPNTEIVNQTWDEHRAVLAAHQPFRNLLLRRTDSRGEAHLVAVSGKPIFDAQGTFCGYHGVASDLTAQMRAEDDLRRFRLAMDSSADMILLVDRATMRFVDANSTVCRLLGYTREELLAKRPEELLPVSREELEVAYDRQIADPSVPGGLKSYYRCKDGSRLPFESKRQVLRSGDKWLISIVSRDIRERLQAENALRESEARFRALTELSSDLYWETDAEHRISQYAYGAKISAIIPVSELLGRRRWEIPGVVIPDEEGWRAHRAMLDAHLAFRDFEIARRDSDGNVRHFSLSGEPVLDVDGAFAGYRGVGREITERKTAEAQLDQLAHYDTLTGLPNRALLHDRMRQAMARADRGRTLLAVMFLDLDRFKEINDALGHAVGDAVLKEAGRRVQSCLRSTDTVGRLGGDEFTVLLEDVHDVDEVSAVAGKILDAFTEPAEVADHELHLSASIGITLYPLDNQDADSLLKNADIAMYQAKQEGRDNFQFFAAEMSKRTERGAGVRLRLHHALERGDFTLHYQPQVHATSGRITGVEALLRWTDAELGPVPPGQFIPVAEETGLIVPIGDWVLREACRQCKSWLDAGLGLLRVAVNLSPRQFRQKKLARRIGEILRETGLPAACLEIEITEGIVMQHAERAVTTLAELNRVGVQIAIDDFGTGYSSLAYLQRFPVHVLKIDQSFVQAIRGRTDQAPIVNTVIQLAKLLGLKALAEGVETAEQREYLRVHGCDALQGYLFCKPQPAERIGELLAAHRRESASA